VLVASSALSCLWRFCFSHQEGEATNVEQAIAAAAVIAPITKEVVESSQLQFVVGYMDSGIDYDSWQIVSQDFEMNSDFFVDLGARNLTRQLDLELEPWQLLRTPMQEQSAKWSIQALTHTIALHTVLTWIGGVEQMDMTVAFSNSAAP